MAVSHYLNNRDTVARAEEPEVVVVTGASAGLGRAIVQEFARHKARVALMARDADRLEKAVREAVKLGGDAMAIPLDVVNAEQVHEAASQVEDRFGPIDI